MYRPPAQVLLIQRGKEPSKGLWSFPGGSLELGVHRSMPDNPHVQAAAIASMLDVCSCVDHLAEAQVCDKSPRARAGETMVECAEREMLEETGLRLRNVSAIRPFSPRAVGIAICQCLHT